MRVLQLCLLWLLAAACQSGEETEPTGFGAPELVTIQGYTGHAMEPFLSPDGRWLLFNNLNDPAIENTELHYAEAVAGQWVYRGTLTGANSLALDAVPSLATNGTLCMISTRNFGNTFNTVFLSSFANGAATDVVEVRGTERSGLPYAVFDAEISRDGQQLLYTDGKLNAAGLPDSAGLVAAVRVGNTFVPNAAATALLANLNRPERLLYAATLSANGLELFATLYNPSQPAALPWLIRADRSSPTTPFRPLTLVTEVPADWFVEAPTLSTDGRTLYFHRKEANGLHRLYRMTRP